MKAGNLLAAMLVLVSPGGAHAQDSALDHAGTALGERFYVSPLASYTWADSERRADDGFNWAVAIGKQFNPKLAIEMTHFSTDFGAVDAVGGEQMKAYGAGVLLFPMERLPNAFGILAGYYGDHGGRSEYSSIVYDLGLGYLIGPFRFLNYGSVRAEVRARFTNFDETVDGDGNHTFLDPVANLGLIVPLGAAPTPPPEPEPEPPVVVEPVVPADSDDDGVVDTLDECPDTPPGAAVDARGCELPPPPPCEPPAPGREAELEGCAAGETITLQGVVFEVDSARLTANARTILDGVAASLNRAPQVRVEVAGHTDATGGDRYNQALSERRAQAVVDYLQEQNIDTERMTAQGYGESEPVDDNDTVAGRERNRRVELRVQ